MIRSEYGYIKSHNFLFTIIIIIFFLTLDMIGMFNCIDILSYFFFLIFISIYMYTLSTIAFYLRPLVSYDVY